MYVIFRDGAIMYLGRGPRQPDFLPSYDIDSVK